MVVEPGEQEAAGGEELLDRVIGFGRYLRRTGLPVGAGQTMDLLRSVDAVGLGREDFKLAARTTLVTRKEDLPTFDRAFDLYWRVSTFGPPEVVTDDGALCVNDPDEAREQGQSGLPAPRQDKSVQREEERERGRGHRKLFEDDPEKDAEPELVLTYSASERLRHKDFAQYTPEEIHEAKRIMTRIGWKIGRRRSRRTVPSHKGAHLDPRRSLRGSLKCGEVVELARRRHKLKPRQLVVICDISGSMDRYSRVLLQFLHTVEHGPNPVETFVFSTRLTRITRQLRLRNIDDALNRVSKEVHDWSGGTRIGESLRAFNTVWARRVLRRGAVVLIISDGWDRGDVDVLRGEMARLQRGAHRLVWLNPLLGSPTYQPLTRGIRAALPYVDDFLPVHNLDSLETLALNLATVPSRRPVRRQTLHLAEAPNIDIA